MPTHSNDLCSGADPAEISFLRSQLDRTARESTLRLELVSSECESRIEQISRKHDAEVRMLRREHDTKLVLVRRECEGKVEGLQCELESLRCQYDAKLDIMKIECEEKVRKLETEMDVLAVARLKAQEECKEREVELTKVHAERDEEIVATKSKDADTQRLRYVVHISINLVRYS